MPDIDDDLLDDEDLEDEDEPNTDEDDGEGEDSESDSDDDQAEKEPTVADALARISALERQTADHRRDIVAAVGRLQSLQAKIEAGDGTAATVREVRTAQRAADAALAALLEDEAIDPKVKARAAEASRQAIEAGKGEDEREQLLARLKAIEDREKNVQTPADVPNVSPLEREIWAMIESFGLNKEDPAFDWKGAATEAFNTGGESGARRYFTSKIRELLEDDKADGRRQMRRSAAATTTKPTGKTTNELDTSRPIKDRLAYLREVGAI